MTLQSLLKLNITIKFYLINANGVILITVEPRLTTIPLMRPPLYYGHFILARKKAQSVIFLFKEPLKYDHPVNTASFTWPEGDSINIVNTLLCPLIFFYDGDVVA